MIFPTSTQRPVLEVLAAGGYIAGGVYSGIYGQVYPLERGAKPVMWVRRGTADALIKRGWIVHEPSRWVITEAGREALHALFDAANKA